MRPSEVSGRSYNSRLIFSQVWNDRTDARGETLKGVGAALVSVRTEEEVIRAFDPWPSYQQEFASMASLILRVLLDPKLPKRPEPQMIFLADSLAGLGVISPRRSRDVWACERAKEKARTTHRILRREFYIECSCRYKGPARNDACPKCGAEVPLP